MHSPKRWYIEKGGRQKPWSLYYYPSLYEWECKDSERYNKWTCEYQEDRPVFWVAIWQVGRLERSKSKRISLVEGCQAQQIVLDDLSYIMKWLFGIEKSQTQTQIDRDQPVFLLKSYASPRDPFVIGREMKRVLSPIARLAPFSPKTVFLASKPYIWTVGSFQVFCAVNTDSGLGKTPLHTFWITLHGHSWGRVLWGSSIATAYAPQGIISAKLWFIRRTVETRPTSKMMFGSNSSHWRPTERSWER